MDVIDISLAKLSAQKTIKALGGGSSIDDPINRGT